MAVHLVKKFYAFCKSPGISIVFKKDSQLLFCMVLLRVRLCCFFWIFSG